MPAVTSKQESTDLTGKSRYVGGRVKRLAGASLRQKAMSSGLHSWSSVAVTGKPDAVKVARPVWSGGKTARSYLSLPKEDRAMTAPYLSFDDLLKRVDQPYQSACQRLLAGHDGLFRSARGSSHNHQAWAGGYADHIREVMNLAVVQHESL